MTLFKTLPHSKPSLSGLIVDSDGNRTTPTHAVKNGKRYRYYVSTAPVTGTRAKQIKGWRIPAGDIEELVLDRLRAFFSSSAEVSDAIAPLGFDAATQRAVLDRSAKLAERWITLVSLEFREIVRSLVQQIQIDDAQITVWHNRSVILSSVIPGITNKPMDFSQAVESLVMPITASLRRAGNGVRLVIGNGANSINSDLAALIVRAIATRNMLFVSRDGSIDAMAARIGRLARSSGRVRASLLVSLPKLFEPL